MSILVPDATGVLATDTANVRGAFAAALPTNSPVELGSGRYQLEGAVLGGGLPISGCSLRGQGPMATRLDLVGPPDATLLWLDHNKYFTLADLSLAGARQQQTAIAIGRQGGPWNGTMAGNCFWQNVAIDNFDVGVRIGRSGQASASELLLQQLNVSRCRVGVLGETYNSLNVIFDFLTVSQCETGVFTASAGAFHIRSGAAAGNGLDFALNSGGAHSVANVRSEGAGRFLNVASTTACTPCVVQGCTVVGIRNLDQLAVSAGPGAELVLLGNDLFGKVELRAQHPPPGSLTMLGGGVLADRPFEPTKTTLRTGRVPYTVLNVGRIGTHGSVIERFPSEIGYVDGATGLCVPTLSQGADVAVRADALYLGNEVLTAADVAKLRAL